MALTKKDCKPGRVQRHSRTKDPALGNFHRSTTCRWRSRSARLNSTTPPSVMVQRSHCPIPGRSPTINGGTIHVISTRCAGFPSVAITWARVMLIVIVRHRAGTAEGLVGDVFCFSSSATRASSALTRFVNASIRSTAACATGSSATVPSDKASTAAVFICSPSQRRPSTRRQFIDYATAHPLPTIALSTTATKWTSAFSGVGKAALCCGGARATHSSTCRGGDLWTTINGDGFEPVIESESPKDRWSAS